MFLTRQNQYFYPVPYYLHLQQKINQIIAKNEYFFKHNILTIKYSVTLSAFNLYRQLFATFSGKNRIITAFAANISLL